MQNIVLPAGLENQIVCEDCLLGMQRIPDQSIDICITDPPYFIDGMGDQWSKAKLADKTKKAGVIKSMPVGMKFDPKQGIAFEAFMRKVAPEVYRVLKPGAFFICFSQARLYHRLGVAVEDSGFELRDMLGWTYSGQAKAFGLDHIICKDGSLSDAEKAARIAAIGGRKTPQLRPCIEPMVLAQKPKDGTFAENWFAHGTGLVDTTARLDDKFPGNLMPVAKPGVAEKGEGNEHLTVKPVSLIEHLLRLFSTEDQVMLDPFSGSGSHAVAALKAGRRFIGFEKDPEYRAIAIKRIGDAH